NEDQGSINPSSYKNMTYSVAVSWLDNKNVEYDIFPDFKTMFDIIIEVYGGKSKKPCIFLNAHNSNKYDNHFLRIDLLYYYPHMTIENFFLNTAKKEETKDNEIRLKDLSKKDKECIILEKRIKSSINL